MTRDRCGRRMVYLQKPSQMDDMTTGFRFAQLKKNQQRDSKPRFHLLTSGPREEVARRLTSLIEPW
jgi:hypothetical protein